MGYSDYTDIKNSIDFTNCTDAIIPNSSGIYDITYTILNTTNVGTFSYGGESNYYSGSTEADVANGHFHDLTTAQTDALDIIFSPGDYSVLFGDVAPITFSSSSSGAIAIGQASSSNTGDFFGDHTMVDLTQVGAKTFISESTPSTAAMYGDVWLNQDWVDKATPPNSLWTDDSPGTEGFVAILHELGHSLGLVHPMTPSADWNTQQYTIMSNVGSIDVAENILPSGLQMYDILALQSIYGVNWGGDRGDGGLLENTVYSAGNGFGATADKAFLYTIWDGAGVDIIDASDYSVSSQIDLRQGHFSSIGLDADNGTDGVPFDDQTFGDRGNVGIAYYTVIENAIGTSHDDTLIGNEWNNVLYGGDGNDKIYGDGISYDQTTGFQENTFADASGAVWAWGPDDIAPAANDSGDDVLIGGAGNDTFYGGEGNDVVHGGYVKADIDSVVTGWDPAGQFTGTNNAAGVALTDITWNGSGTADGLDTINYSQLVVGTSGNTGIHVTFDNTAYTSPTTVVKGYSGEYGTDTLFSVERIVGTPWNDTFDGSSTYITAAYGSKGNDTYSVVSSFGVDYSTLDALGTNAHLSVTASSTGLTIVKSDDNGVGYLGQDTTNLWDANVVGTAGSDSFSGYIVGGHVGYGGAAGSDTYSFDMAGLIGGSVHTADVDVTEDASGSFSSDVHVANSDGMLLVNYTTFLAGGTSTEFLYTDSANPADALTITFGQSGTTSMPTFVVGATTLEFGTVNDDTFTAASGIHVYAGGGSGSDTVDYGAATGAVTANLATNSASNNGWGYADSYHDISNIIGSSHDDTLTGDANANILNGGAGNDIISGGAGNDTLIAGTGNDTLDGGAGSDTVDYSGDASFVSVDLYHGFGSDTDGTDTITNIENIIGTPNNDFFIENSADNTIDGGAGTDAVYFYYATSGVTVDLVSGTATGDGNDTLISIEYVRGSTHNDTLIGSSTDTLDGWSGNDTLEYGQADYSLDPAGVTINLATGTATDGWGGTDTLIGIHSVMGSASYGDTITCDSSRDTVLAQGGNDLVYAGSGSDTLDGGSGTDTISYANASSGVTVSLATTGAQNTIGAGTDTIINFENLTGSAYDDTLTGDGNANVIDGGAGNDIMDGGAGVDTLSYASATSGITISLAITTGQATGGSGTDTISNFENITGSAYNDTLTGDAGNNVIDGGAGNDIIQGGGGDDTLTGGAGTDTVSYDAATAAVTVSLAITTAQNTGGAGTDTISGFENLTGSAFNDTLTGDSNANTISGGAGDDIIAGRGGADTIDGGAGINTVDYSAAAAGVTVDLSTGSASNDGDGSSDTLTNIQNITGSAFNDTLNGDGNANVIEGGAGNDTMTGGAGTDTVTYAHATAAVTVNLATTSAQNTVGAGTDTISGFENLTGSAFNDTLTGDANNNVIDGGAGNDTMNGAGGVDTLTYANATGGITISLAITTGQATGGSGTDTISNFENLTGSAYDDTLTGSSGANTIDGGAGNDIIQGGAGNDTLIGGAGIDTALYAAAASAVTVNLSTGTATGGAGTDTLSGFENITGSAFNDTLTGDGNDNVIDGGAGSDTMNGGAGTDTLTYATATAAITISLAITTGQATGGSGTDTISNFENLIGSNFNDTLTGSSGNNVIEGLGGNDTLNGGAGTDTVSYEHATAGVTVSLATTSAQNTVGAGTDTISNFENLTGSSHNDTLTGSSGNNVIEGLDGNDTMNGGAGTDTVSYEHATAAVTVSLATTSAQNTFGAGTDTISNFENLTGSAYDDTLTGSSGVNTITGGDGNDTITGGGGADILYGGNGSDTFLFLAATALGASVNVQDFTNGAGGDKLDIKDVISGYDPATMAITDWVQITTSGSNSLVKVDIDGAGTGHTWQQIATIVGVTGMTDVAAEVASGNLVVHT